MLQANAALGDLLWPGDCIVCYRLSGPPGGRWVSCSRAALEAIAGKEAQNFVELKVLRRDTEVALASGAYDFVDPASGCGVDVCESLDALASAGERGLRAAAGESAPALAVRRRALLETLRSRTLG